MTKRRKEDLGKGIRALLQDVNVEQKSQKAFAESDSTSEDKSGGIQEISLSQIEVNPFQPRAEFNEEALQDLAESIRIHGVIQPITVRKLSNGNYQLIAGERRTRASKIAGLRQIPAFVREADDQEMLEIALIENIQREDLNALEIAVNYKRLMEECSLTQEKLAERLGKSRSAITNFLRLLKLAPGVQHALKKGAISMGHARAILGVSNFDEQEEYCIKVIERDLSVRQVEQLIKQTKQPTAKREDISAAWVEYKNILSKLVGKPANIRRKSTGKGEIVIPFTSDEELDAIIDRLEKE